MGIIDAFALRLWWKIVLRNGTKLYRASIALKLVTVGVSGDNRLLLLSDWDSDFDFDFDLDFGCKIVNLL